MVYADGSNPSVRKDIGVRLPSPAHSSGSRLPGDVAAARQNVVAESTVGRTLYRPVSSILGFAEPPRRHQARASGCAGRGVGALCPLVPLTMASCGRQSRRRDLNYSFGRPETANECHLGLITPREPSRDGKR